MCLPLQGFFGPDLTAFPWVQASIRRRWKDGAPKWEFRVVGLNKCEVPLDL